LQGSALAKRKKKIWKEGEVKESGVLSGWRQMGGNRRVSWIRSDISLKERGSENHV